MKFTENIIQTMGILWGMVIQTLKEIPFDFDSEDQRQKLLDWTRSCNPIIRDLIPYQSLKDPMSLNQLLALKRLADDFPRSNKLAEHLKACTHLKEQAGAMLGSDAIDLIAVDLIAIYAQDFCEHHREYVAVCTELEVTCWEPLNVLARQFAAIVKENK